MQLAEKRILLGVTGGIAAYKSADLVRRLREAGAQVKVVMTPAAQKLVTPLTFHALSGHQVILDWEQSDSEMGMDHIALTRWADLIVIAPATADFMARLAHGFANDVLSTLCLAATIPKVIVPAMNVHMWENPATVANVALLKEQGHFILEPTAGEQACGDVGVGRMLEPLPIVHALLSHFSPQILKGLKVVITAGPTQEPIDPVRYLTNHSSGKMGYSLAQVAALLGARVVLISGPVHLSCPWGVNLIHVLTCQQMYDEVMHEISDAQVFIAAAAVSDYRLLQPSIQKIKKTESNLKLELEKTPDILSAVSALNTNTYVVGFAAETENLLSNARQKLQRKKVDMMIANDVSHQDIGFGSEDNAVTALWESGEQFFSKRSKRLLAHDLWQLIVRQMKI